MLISAGCCLLTGHGVCSSLSLFISIFRDKERISISLFDFFFCSVWLLFADCSPAGKSSKFVISIIWFVVFHFDDRFLLFGIFCGGCCCCAFIMLGFVSNRRAHALTMSTFLFSSLNFFLLFFVIFMFITNCQIYLFICPKKKCKKRRIHLCLTCLRQFICKFTFDFSQKVLVISAVPFALSHWTFWYTFFEKSSKQPKKIVEYAFGGDDSCFFCSLYWERSCT